MNETEAILHQKSWTGDQVGKALISSAIHSYKQVISGNREPTELFSAAHLQRMVDSLSNREQLLRYNRYVGLNNWLTQYQAVANAYLQLANSNIEVLSFMLKVAEAVEEDTKAGYAPHAVSTTCGLEQYTDTNSTAGENRLVLEHRRREIESAYRHLLGYDCAITLIAEHIEIRDFTIFAADYRYIANKMRAINKQSASLLARIEASNYNTSEVKESKLRTLRDCFPPFLYDQMFIPDQAIRKAKALLQDNLRAFETQDGRFMRLFTEWENTEHD